LAIWEDQRFSRMFCQKVNFFKHVNKHEEIDFQQPFFLKVVILLIAYKNVKKCLYYKAQIYFWKLSDGFLTFIRKLIL